MADTRNLLAVFIDFENLALGFRDRTDRFDIHRVIGRLVEKGTLVVKRAYADWKRFGSYSSGLHEHAIELIQIPSRGMTGKNSADMRLCVDVMDMCYSKHHINTFVVVSGDSDFSPLVSKLRENGRTVIGLGAEESTSDLLRDNCDEFIYYEDLERDDVPEDRMKDLSGKELSAKERQLYALLLESLHALRRENRETFWASLIKETMKRKRPSFNESYYGFKSFGELLEAAADDGFVALSRDGRTHIVTAFGDEVTRGAAAAAAGRGTPTRRSTSSSTSRSSGPSRRVVAKKSSASSTSRSRSPSSSSRSRSSSSRSRSASDDGPDDNGGSRSHSPSSSSSRSRSSLDDGPDDNGGSRAPSRRKKR